MITRIVKMTFRSEEAVNFEALFHERSSLISGFPGCKGVELLKEESDSNSLTYFTRSIWIDDASLQAYRSSELFADTWKQTKAKFADKAEAWSTKIVESKFE